MTIVVPIVLGVLLAAVALGALAVLRQSLDAGRGAPPMRQRVMLNLRQPDDVQMRGVLTYIGRRWLVLESAEVLDDDGATWTAIVGAQHIPAANVLNVSRL